MIRTVADLFALWPSVAAGLGKRDEDTIAHTLAMAGPFERTFGRRLLDGLATPEVAQWAARFPSHARYARTILNDGVKLGALSVSPFVGVQVRAPEGRGEFTPSWAEAMALVDAGERYGLGLFTLMACCSGGRLGALAVLQRSGVEGGRVKLARKGRSGTYETVLLEPARARLEAEGPEVGRLFSRPRGGAWDRRGVSRVWGFMREDLGLPGACTFHSTRKAFATRLLDEGASMMDVAFALDHVDRNGRPQVEQVERVYGKPSRDAALARLVAA